MICFIKNIVSVVYLWIAKIFILKRCNLSNKNILFINTEKLGDLVVSSYILENSDAFKGYNDVYFLVTEQYIDLFRNYSGKVKIIGLSKSKFKKSIFYNIKFIKYINSLRINQVYNISQARGFLNEIVTNLNLSARRYATNNNFEYLGSLFKNYWNGKYEKVLFDNIENEYKKISELVLLFENGNVKNKNKVFNVEQSYYSEAKYISISPYSSDSIKNWPTERFRAIIMAYNKKIKFIILCSSTQKKQALKDFRDIQNVVISDATLSKTIGIISNSILFIGNDSGLTHLSSKIGVRTIGIIGGGMYSRYFPIPGCGNTIYCINHLDCFNCNWVCKYKAPLCLNEISEIKIRKIITSIINERII